MIWDQQFVLKEIDKFIHVCYKKKTVSCELAMSDALWSAGLHPSFYSYCFKSFFFMELSGRFCERVFSKVI